MGKKAANDRHQPKRRRSVADHWLRDAGRGAITTYLNEAARGLAWLSAALVGYALASQVGDFEIFARWALSLVQ